MATEYYVITTDLQTGEEIDSRGGGWSERRALESAEKQAEEYFSGDDATWFESIGPGEYHVGRIMPDGTRSDPLVKIVVEEVEEEEAD